MRPGLSDTRRWGRWYLDNTKPVSLNIALAPGYIYDIPLRRCQTQYDRDIWISHMAEKSLVISKVDIGDLTRAFADLIAEGVIAVGQGANSFTPIKRAREAAAASPERWPVGRPRENVLRRFIKYITKTSVGCWQWTGPREYGYPQLFDGRAVRRAARYSYELLVGAIPEGQVISQRCNHRDCVNPEHLVLGAPLRQHLGAINAARQKAKTHCPHGHPYDEANTYWYRNALGHRARMCRTCMRERDRQRSRGMVSIS